MKNDQPIPNAVFHLLKAVRLTIVLNGRIPCDNHGKSCDKNCVYGIVRTDGKVECLYDMVSDAIISMTEE